MGYHVTVLRTIEGEQQAITQSEIEQAVKCLSGWEFSVEKSEATFDINGAWLVTVFFSDGELWTKNPDEEALSALIVLAEKLNARVRGDEYETYRTSEDFYLHPDDKALKAAADASTHEFFCKRKRSQWLQKIAVFGFYLLIALVFLIDKNCSST